MVIGKLPIGAECHMESRNDRSNVRFCSYIGSRMPHGSLPKQRQLCVHQEHRPSTMMALAPVKTYNIVVVEFRLNRVAVFRIPTFDIKHCFTTKSRTSNGPSLHQQNRCNGLPFLGSISPCWARNLANILRTLGNVGAQSTWAYIQTMIGPRIRRRKNGLE